MEGLVSYSLPVKGLHDGIHEFQFHVDDRFFSCFENAPVGTADIDLTLTLDKRPGMMVLEFDFAGTIATECDRCLAPIQLPIEDTQTLVVKYSEEAEAEEADVIFIHPEASDLDVSRYVYEFIVLAIPMIRVYDCASEDPPVCNEEMLRLLEQQEGSQEEGGEENPVWKQLKDLYRKK